MSKIHGELMFYDKVLLELIEEVFTKYAINYTVRNYTDRFIDKECWLLEVVT